VIDAELSLMRNDPSESDPSESDPSKSGPSADSGPGPASLRVLGIDPMAAALVTPGLMPEPRATSAEPDPDQGSEAKPQARSESRDEAPLQGPPGASLFSSDAIFLSQAAMRALRVNPGDTIRVRAGLSTVALRVQGTVPGAAPHQVLAVMDIAVMQWRLGWAGRLSRIDLRLKPQARLEPLAQQWQTESKGAWTLATPEAANTRASMLSRAYRINLNVLALMALFTGSFIVYATLALSSAQQRPALAVLAVLGWVARLPARQDTPTATVEGYVRPGDHAGFFAAADDITGRRFYTLDPAAIGHALGFPDIAPYVLVALGPPGPNEGPDPAPTLPRPPDNHLTYAITWFGLAAALIGVFIAFARKVLRS
jgi:hypothetical protein